jgi:glycosyltransferase involved in cell wall biosynthesis
VDPADADRGPRARARASVVIPCYDEAARLPAARYKDFLREHPEVSFVFVDDGSRDGTLDLLRSIERVDPERVSVLALPENAGKAEAVRRGILRALDADVDYVGFWDADLATPLAAIPEFVKLLDARPELELAIGSRVVLLGRRVERRALRHYLGRIAATLISVALGLRVYDTQCGAKLFRANASARELFREPFRARWAFDVEILARLVRSRRGRALPPAEAVTCEVPLSEWIDVAGSKIRPRDYLRAGVDLLRIWWRELGRGRG